MKTIAIIPSGGSGLRTGLSVPKQYVKIFDKEILAYTLEVFQNCPLIDEIIVPAKSGFFDVLLGIKNKFNITKLVKVVEGGKERQHSVFNALSAIPPDINPLIAVHDAARPLLSQNVLISAINTAKEKSNAVVAIQSKDTLVKHFQDSFDYIKRDNIYNVQTPQIFEYNTLIEAFKFADSKNFIGTDESMLVYNLGYKINIVEGSLLNFKITNQQDIDLFKQLVSSKNAL
ncbi:MAG: 2-C-methyl-D-erythritol 4-phosphate cytidylyltransferase [bacterium]